MRAVVACTTVIGDPEQSEVKAYVYNQDEVPEFDQLSADEMDRYRTDDSGWVADTNDYSQYELDWDNVQEPGMNAKQKCLAAREASADENLSKA